MAITANDIVVEAQGLLNDTSGLVYTSARLLPIIQKSYRELQTKLAKYGIAIVNEVSSIVQVDAGVLTIAPAGNPPLPTDFLYPITLFEKARGAAVDTYVEMNETRWEATELPTDTLRMWDFREEEIKFVGATTNRDVLIRYRKGLTKVTATSTPIAIADSETFLSARTAAIAAVVIGENEERGSILSTDATIALDDVLSIHVRRMQTRPVRRMRTRYRQ